MQCDLCPYRAAPTPNQDVTDDCRPPLLRLWLEGHSPLGKAPSCADTTDPHWALPLTATQSFRDYPYGLGSIRELETFFPSLCFNLYGLKQSLNGMPRPGGLGNGFMSPGANGSPSAPGIRADGCGRLLPRNVDPITVSTRYSARPRPGVWVGRPR